MRLRRILGFLFAMSVSACFEDASTVDDGAGDTMTCAPGSESCPCLDGECVGGLMCLSNVCVSPMTTPEATGDGPSSAGPTSTGPTSASTTDRPAGTTAADTGTTDAGPTDSGPTDSGPTDSGPTDSGGPPLAPCDPLLQDCRLPTLACNMWDDDGFYCGPFGGTDAGDPCEVFSCQPGFVCLGEALVPCVDAPCCVALCDLLDPETCPMNLNCSAVYLGADTPPGYESVGICAVLDN